MWLTKVCRPLFSSSEKVSKIIESSIETMMALFASKDQELKNFWENNIKKQLDIVLKAA
ncbi:MAG: hypothetical protein HQK52_23755 [Oligoflexia bacterium]|nr:hypothetical protein [Oligoflexia bacterium]